MQVTTAADYSVVKDKFLALKKALTSNEKQAREATEHIMESMKPRRKLTRPVLIFLTLPPLFNGGWKTMQKFCEHTALVSTSGTKRLIWPCMCGL